MASSRIGMMYWVSVKVCPNSKVLTPIPRVIVATCKIRKPEPCKYLDGSASTWGERHWAFRMRELKYR